MNKTVASPWNDASGEVAVNVGAGLPAIPRKSPRRAIAVNPAPAPAPVGAGLPAIQHTTAFNPPRARTRTTPLREKGRGESDIRPPTAPARMPARPASGDNT
jgi:hypothetical protein